MTIQCMHVACWILRATNTHTQVVLFHCNTGCMNVLHCYVYMYIASLVLCIDLGFLRKTEILNRLNNLFFQQSAFVQKTI